MALRERLRRLAQRPGSADIGPLQAVVAEAGRREDDVRALDDAALTAAVAELRETGLRADADLAAFCALGREAARRALGERPFDVQLVGVLALLSGRVAEMATGEGKTLAGALAAAGHALRGRRVHVLSVNDYLARRDAEWMRPLHALLGMTSGWVVQESAPDERRAAYAADITYAPVSEVGFDLLRDRLATDPDALVLPEPGVALIDEADSVLVDEAMVPLVLAGNADDEPTTDTAVSPDEPTPTDLAVSPDQPTPTDLPGDHAELVRRLRPGRDYTTDEEARNVQLTPAGAREVERALGGIDLYAPAHLPTLTAVNLALHAEALLHRDVDYIVRDGAVKLISESRGRVALLQRWPDGLHAAVEAKERLAASPGGEILDSITVQELIGRYPVRCGMTGTALAVAGQLREFYELDVVVVPPNRPRIRVDEPDRLYATADDRDVAVVEVIADAHAAGRPVLAGTPDVAASERLARRLRRAGLDPVVLNAKNDAAEAAIIAEAGAYGAITVSTQMAGRGTDIRLGGADGADRDRAAEAGGLLVVGTGHYHSSRLDDQLRGRAGRQGDPGGSVFLTALTDDLVTRYAPDQTYDGPTADDGLVTDKGAHWIAGHAQRVAEGVDLEIHRNTWRYNHLIGLQREDVLAERDRVLRGDAGDALMRDRAAAHHRELTDAAGEDAVAAAARQLVLFHLDRTWSRHLAYLADLREGIHLRSLGRGLDPLVEFNREAVPAGKRLLADARDAAVEAFNALPPDVDLTAAGVRRPTATWTYIAHDNPFGTLDERAFRGLVAMFTGRRGRSS
ncbi:accessory Sec system translocase SecA2 [Actinomadura rayongensis]|uniref:Protein translocase subunit SecA n=1 Tax=Actinomadura rayongensis TaxID=1429076 RepID=A0A6I4W997_9ACTN|nr:accessory Sec system translocase SecA2 [Actinomadura rayongensis]MXQ63644.1 accessory Sec system translocase SecA2 [Actinomadura rayongensis]